MAASSSPACRICQGEEAPIIRPCRCEGTMAYAHPYCLAEWIASRGHLSCEVCRTPYSFQVAVKEPPALHSVRDAARVVALIAKNIVSSVARRFGAIGRAVAAAALLVSGTVAIWLCCWWWLLGRETKRRSFRSSLLPFLGFGVMATMVSALLLFCYHRFTVWAFIHEDELPDIPAAPVVPPPPMPAMDEAAAAALNSQFTDTGVAEGSQGRRYVAAAQAEVSFAAVLQLLQQKVDGTKPSSERRRIWEHAHGGAAAKLLALHGLLAASVALGDAVLRSVVLALRLLAGLTARAARTRHSLLLAVPGEALAAAPHSALPYWGVAFVVGAACLVLVMRCAATRFGMNYPHLAHSVLLGCVFTRGALTTALLIAVWATVIPIAMYVCLFPFYVEGDATIAMAPSEAWHTLRSERLLPFKCRGVSASPPFVTAPLTQPLNVLRALVFAVPDVWRGQGPALFDPNTCGADADTLLSQASLLLRATHYAAFAGCVLLRVCTLTTWATLLGMLRSTLLWILSGTLVALCPHTSLAAAFHDEHAFFYLFTHLRGRAFLRAFFEIPLCVVLYTSTVGFFTFAVLLRAAPDAFPRSVSFLSFYVVTNGLSEFDFLYCWFRIIKAGHSALHRAAAKLFLGDGGHQGDQAVERAAYGVSLFCAHVAVGLLLECAASSALFSFVGLSLHFLYLVWQAAEIGGGFPPLRRRLSTLGTQLTLFGVYGTRVTLKDGVPTCICRKVLRVRQSEFISALARDAFEQSDVRLLAFLADLVWMPPEREFVCSREVLDHVAAHTAHQLFTVRRGVALSALALLGPLTLCSFWHLDFATPLSTDYIVLPWWLCLVLRWSTGVAAAAVWLFIEWRLLRSALSRRCLEFAPQILLGVLSAEVLHAVAIPLMIHGGAVRLLIATVEQLSSSTLLVESDLLSSLTIAAVLLLSVFQQRLKDAFVRGMFRLARRPGLWRREAAAAPLVRPLEAPEVLPPVGDAVDADAAEEQPREEGGDNGAVDREESEEDDAAHGAEQAPSAPLPQSRFVAVLKKLGDRLLRLAASDQATDVVLVSYADSRSAHL